MGYILGVLDYIAYIAADVDFYNIEGNSGDSYLPFVYELWIGDKAEISFLMTILVAV